MEGTSLDAGQDCRYELKTSGVVWPNIIWLAYPRNGSSSVLDHADFQVDWEAVRRVARYVGEHGFDRQKDQLEETLVGLFVTYSDLDKRVNPGIPSALRLGFGHLGAAPAQLVIQTVRDPVIVPIVAAGAAKERTVKAK